MSAKDLVKAVAQRFAGMGKRERIAKVRKLAAASAAEVITDGSRLAVSRTWPLGSYAETLHRAGEFFGEDLGFLGEVAGAGPVTGLRGFASVFQEAFDLGDQVGLRGVQLLVARGRKIFLGNVQALSGFLLRGGRFFLGKLRGNGGSFGLLGIGRGSVRGGGSGIHVRAGRRAVNRNHHGDEWG
jgi:hypothetical protein